MNMKTRSIASIADGPIQESTRPEMQVRKLALGILLQAFRDVAARIEELKPRVRSHPELIIK